MTMMIQQRPWTTKSLATSRANANANTTYNIYTVKRVSLSVLVGYCCCCILLLQWCYHICYVDATTGTIITRRFAYISKQPRNQLKNGRPSLSSPSPSPSLTTKRKYNNNYRTMARRTCRWSTSGTGNNSNDTSNKNNDVGGYDPSEGIEISDRGKERSIVGNPQQVLLQEKEFSVTSILKELAAIQQQGPQKYCILGTRHCSYLHQQIIELLAYALVLSGNHVYTSGSSGTNAATIRGALRAERPDLLTVVLPQSLMKQTEESQQLLKQVKDVIEMPQNNDLSLDIASRICNSYLLSLTDQLISFAFHESTTVIEAAKEAKELDKLVTVLYLD